jgi:hypothetical protein
MSRRGVVVMLMVVACVGVVVGCGCRQHKAGSQGGSAAPGVPVTFEEAQTRAFDVIRQRERWPESPEAVCRSFWEARATKDYAEMEVLWPGSASFHWPETCKNEPPVMYVFGPAGADGSTVPYATKDHFDAQKTYNLTMHLRVLQTDKGPRWYIISGN